MSAITSNTADIKYSVFLGNYDDDDLRPTPGLAALLEVESHNLAVARAKKAEQKINTVHRFILANQKHTMAKIVDKFDLVAKAKETLKNGLIVVGFYTDDTCKFLVATQTVEQNNEWGV
jgi:hypothetical protein